MTRRAAWAAATALALLLSGCSVVPTGESTDQVAPGASNPTAAAVDLLQARYEFIRDGEYERACALYAPGFVALLAELAETDAGDCVAVHEAAARNADEYLATAQEQGRAGLTPFFFVPSAIEIDEAQITSDDPTEAIIGSGAVVSLDDREFEDGTGITPGWLAGLVYVAQADDGTWRFVAPGER